MTGRVKPPTLLGKIAGLSVYLYVGYPRDEEV
jgi:hypothetical protein